jgi:hypothetical protein
MTRKYLFQHKIFWISISAIYLVLFLINYVEVNYQVNFDIASPVFEPTYHLLLRKAGFIQSGEFSRYSNSLMPITYNLPYFILAITILTAVIVSILYVVQKVYRVFKKVDKDRS